MSEFNNMTYFNNLQYRKMFEFFTRYFKDFDVQIETESGSQQLVQELIAGFKVFVENENIKYGDWFEKLHYLIDEEGFLESLITKREPHKHHYTNEELS
jgi:hypothetical protein